MPHFELSPISDHISKTYLQQLLEARREGLQRLPVNLDSNDNTLAKSLRTTFHDEIVMPLLDPYVDQSAHNISPNPDYHGTSGYLIGIDVFLEMYQAFRSCEAVQVCFGLDKPLDQGGQLQLVFRGYQNSAPAEAIFITPQPFVFEPPLPGTHPIGVPRVCPVTSSC